MRSRINRLVIIAGFVSVAISVALQQPARPALAAQANPDERQAVLQKVCGSCHTMGKVTGSRRSRAQWEEVTDKMIAAGAKATDEEFTTVINYLVSQYGRANVNTASASEIAEATGLSEQEAEAIVKYRKDKGKFEDFDALSKTPGVAIEKLEKSRDAISF